MLRAGSRSDRLWRRAGHVVGSFRAGAADATSRPAEALGATSPWRARHSPPCRSSRRGGWRCRNIPAPIVFYFTCLTTFVGAVVLALAQVWPVGVLASQAFVAPGAARMGGFGGDRRVGRLRANPGHPVLSLCRRLAARLLRLSGHALGAAGEPGLFGQWPSPVVLAGAAAIAVSGLLAIFGERHARRKAIFWRRPSPNS